MSALYIALVEAGVSIELEGGVLRYKCTPEALEVLLAQEDYLKIKRRSKALLYGDGQVWSEVASEPEVAVDGAR